MRGHATADLRKVRRSSRCRRRNRCVDPSTRDDVAAPEGAVAVPRRPRREVLRRHAVISASPIRTLCHQSSSAIFRLKPEATSPSCLPSSKRRHERCALKVPQRGMLQVIVVIVADEDDVDRRQRGDRDAGWPHAARTEDAERPRMRREDRIGDEHRRCRPDQERGVADERQRHLARRDARRRRRIAAGRGGGGPRRRSRACAST